MVFTGPLSPEKPSALYQMYSKQGNCFSPCDPEDPQAACWWGSALFSHQSTIQLQLPRYVWQCWDLWNFTICASLFIENWWYCNPLLFPCQWFWGIVFLCSSLPVFSLSVSFPTPTPTLSVSPYCLLLPAWSGLPPLGRTHSSFLLWTPCSSYLSWDIFLVCRCAALFSKTSDRFLGCWERFDTYLASCVQGKRQAQGLYSTILPLFHFTFDITFISAFCKFQKRQGHDDDDCEFMESESINPKIIWKNRS